MVFFSHDFDVYALLVVLLFLVYMMPIGSVVRCVWRIFVIPWLFVVVCVVLIYDLLLTVYAIDIQVGVRVSIYVLVMMFILSYIWYVPILWVCDYLWGCFIIYYFALFVLFVMFL